MRSEQEEACRWPAQQDLPRIGVLVMHIIKICIVDCESFEI
jgi:hypothetical protein